MSKSINSTAIVSYTETNGGLVLVGTTQGGSIPTTANIFAPGCKIIDLVSTITYTNVGTTAAPVWESEVLAKTLALTAANLIAMYAVPIAVIPGVPGKAIVVDNVDFVIARTATQFTGGGVVNVQYAATANGAGTKTHADIAAAVVTAGAGTTYTARIPLVLSDVATASINGVGLFISCQTAAFATGTGTATVKVRYHLV